MSRKSNSSTPPSCFLRLRSSFSNALHVFRFVFASIQRSEDYMPDAKATWTDIKVAYPKSVPFKSSLVILTEKLLCIGSKVCFYSVYALDSAACRCLMQ